MNPDIIVIGAGIAGLSAASELARNKLSVLVVDQAVQKGGNFHRQSTTGHSIPKLKQHQQQWSRILGRIEQFQSNITVQCQSRFIGVDYKGVVMIEQMAPNRSALYKPKALVIATGASEQVWPRNGWQSAGVTTVGAIQSELKMTGQVSADKIILAGSGPLLLAAGAQLIRSGTPPVAIIESSFPFRHVSKSLSLPFRYLLEGGSYLFDIIRSAVPFYSGASIQNIHRHNDNNKLNVTVQTKSGSIRSFETEQLGLHDGLKSNDYGVIDNPGILIRKAGDSRQIMGAIASEFDGLNAGSEIAEKLKKSTINKSFKNQLDKYQKAYRSIEQIYNSANQDIDFSLDDETIICRCEHRTLKDLKSLNKPTLREVRLLGRFSMGSCQGRFCANWVEKYLNSETDSNKKENESLQGNRWPVRPVSLSSIIETDDFTNHKN
ncbi:MAG: FAD-dependent oxidoreductase [Gammaproteobacteria bacterium]|jgi:hypothetical protein|nr:FAD-dependent oxidoreductase [Gammaproteobacteria bacterium]MBT3724998.1 FAD-dependent oxidoreductase [Gammaproteobacteria bacterium]MBT4075061.1 FAD-dependent oxidoreductase [Gammaproteobacteria bacterium]MBT4193879.1 FAD-dependent oxidoreductase [Gammaproteobacteria bacterium]MBT4449709.1 FAD-dependent oxidoreductase [Gammaproteobacteria bacterium]